MDRETQLIEITEADRALALAASVPELTDLHDKFTTAKTWAKTRGLGVDAENKAAEYILRTERKIGAELIRMLEAGERAQHGGGTPGQEGFSKLGLPTLAELLGGQDDKSTVRDNAAAWQRLARMPEDVFETMLAEVKATRERIAKINFYAASRPVRIDDPAPERPDTLGYALLQEAANDLLGWQVDDAGVGSATENKLLRLATDELAQVGLLLKALITAYNEAKVRPAGGGR